MRGLNLCIASDGNEERSHLARAHFVSVRRIASPVVIDREHRFWTVRRSVVESGCLHLPWCVEGFGDVMVQTSSLVERDEPYRFAVELARGELNRARNQLAEWELRGLTVPEQVLQELREANQHLGTAIWSPAESEWNAHAQKAMGLSLWAGEHLARAIRDFELQSRSGDGVLGRLGCCIDAEVPDRASFLSTFDHVSVPVDWKSIEPDQGEYRWDLLDRQIKWCEGLGVPFLVGPLLDFRPQSLPSWLMRWESDVQTLVTLLLDFVESCVGRYRDRVTSWEMTARTNSARVLSLSEEQLLWITSRMVEAGRSIAPSARFSFSVDQPWGDYQVAAGSKHSPHAFVDRLLRTDLGVSSIGLEVAMGYHPGGSFCRSVSHFGQLLDSFGPFGVPLHVGLLAPSEAVTSAGPQGQSTTAAGCWHGPPDPQRQADWAEAFAGVALAKPFVTLVTWGRYRDTAGGDWPRAGLLTEEGEAKPALNRLGQLRQSLGSILATPNRGSRE